ncbi:MAG: ribonuclease Z [Bacteroidetes bacterium]|nr:ribonuclease Z [Bacteroidota bacterium]
MSFTLTILGSNAAAPTSERHSSAQLLDTGQHLFLIDCAEGTQMQLRRFKAHFRKINHIFISHLHGDHFFGLIGLLTTFHLLGRDKPVTVYSIPALKEAIDLLLTITQTTLIYPVQYHFFDPDSPEILFEDNQISVSTLPLLHRIPTCGFLFREKPKPRNIKKTAIENVDIPYQLMPRLKNGEDITLDDGRVFLNKDFTVAPPDPLSYAYCSDTGYHEPLVPLIRGVDYLFHESTFIDKDKALALEKQHSTSKDAARIAQLAQVRHLLLGHFSARYKQLDILLQEACEIFPGTQLAEEGKIFRLD